jgi:anti-anti-sigma factor
VQVHLAVERQDDRLSSHACVVDAKVDSHRTWQEFASLPCVPRFAARLKPASPKCSPPRVGAGSLPSVWRGARCPLGWRTPGRRVGRRRNRHAAHGLPGTRPPCFPKRARGVFVSSARAMPPFELEQQETEDPNVLHVGVVGELDLTNARELEDRVDELSNPIPSGLVLDLPTVSSSSTAALHVLFGTARRHRIGIVLSPASPIARTVEIVGLAGDALGDSLTRSSTRRDAEGETRRFRRSRPGYHAAPIQKVGTCEGVHRHGYQPGHSASRGGRSPRRPCPPRCPASTSTRSASSS